MGKNIFIKCKNCSFHKEYDTGVGMMFGDIEFIFNLLEKKEKFEAERIYREYKSTLNYESDGYVLYQCPKCSSVRNKCHLELNKNNKKIFETKSICSYCSIERVKLPIFANQTYIKNFKCPKCKSGNYDCFGGMLWD